MEFNRVTLDLNEGVATLTFNDPEVLNAIGPAMLSGIHDALAFVQSPNSHVRCLLITGAGRGFCSGANLAGDGSTSESNVGSSLRSGYHPLLLSLRDLDIPIVTAVNGAAAGVGMSFALIGDIVCASEKAFFLQAFANIGLVPDGGATFMLPRLIGWSRAVELSLLAERLPAEQALEWGLINRVYDDNEALMVGAEEIARKLAAGPKSLGMIRKMYWDTWHNAYEQQLDLEARMQASAGATADSAEGRAAFLEKRQPNFKGL
ncbi:MAG: enoyl-CoA hydratase/isomerase [Gammaproteobacteria bacterium]|nr:enoyl-CoA hydratase/isomerase [Gammaproteobacteria bacterium]